MYTSQAGGGDTRITMKTSDIGIMSPDSIVAAAKDEIPLLD
ncbi:MAG: hypothetical protein NTZ48_03455 [Candidatus Omnitrophica bacterium]|nr:hypothetical protein [Candidatus Omnitrophota bacterium]